MKIWSKMIWFITWSYVIGRTRCLGEPGWNYTEARRKGTRVLWDKKERNWFGQFLKCLNSTFLNEWGHLLLSVEYFFVLRVIVEYMMCPRGKQQRVSERFRRLIQQFILTCFDMNKDWREWLVGLKLSSLSSMYMYVPFVKVNNDGIPRTIDSPCIYPRLL
jgi:hypothetical protein